MLRNLGSRRYDSKCEMLNFDEENLYKRPVNQEGQTQNVIGSESRIVFFFKQVIASDEKL